MTDLSIQEQVVLEQIAQGRQNEAIANFYSHADFLSRGGTCVASLRIPAMTLKTYYGRKSTLLGQKKSV